MHAEAPRRRRPLFFALLGAIVLIWGYLLYQLVHGFQEEEPVASGAIAAPAPHPGPVQGAAAAADTFRTDYRDPFEIPASLLEAAVAAEEGYDLEGPLAHDPYADDVEPAPLPPVVLSGLVGETAMLKDEMGAVHFGRAGEYVLDLLIVVVGEDYVRVEYDGVPYMLPLGLPAQEP